MTRNAARSMTPRIIVGLMIVAFGAALMLDNLGVMNAGDIIRYWPLGLVAIGVTKFWQDDERSSKIAGALFMVIGLLLLSENLYFIHFHIWHWWPLLIIGVGVLMLRRAFQPGAEPGQVGWHTTSSGQTVFGGVAASKGGGTTEQAFSEFAMWSGVQRRVASPAFKRAELTAIMGGIELDLRQAGTEGGEAVVDVFVMWGGIEITVPPDWAVANQVTPILGGSEDKSSGTQQAKNRLIVKGVVIMGGVDIKT